MKKLQKVFAILLVFCMTMGLLSVNAGAAVKGNSYWDVKNTQENTTILLTEHTVLDSEKRPVAIGAQPGKMDVLLNGLEEGEMAARKFGAFANEADAANGIVKLTFDVVGNPLNVPGPLDVVIIADESGSLNMYGRTNTTAYMPCLNSDHVYLADGLQIELYQIAKLRAAVAVTEAQTRANTAADAADDAVKAANDAAIAAEENPEDEALQAAAEQAAVDAEIATAEAEAAAEALIAATALVAELEQKLTALTTVPEQTNQEETEQSVDGEVSDGEQTPEEPQAVDTRVFIRPASADLQYITFSQWKNYPEQVRRAIEAAGAEIPEILTDEDVCYVLLNDGESLSLNKSGQATYKGKVDWDPDNKHCYLVNGEYTLIPEPENNAVLEGDTLYSYYSPEDNNPYGCYDRMMVQKESIAQLANKIVGAHEKNRVAYVGFAKNAYLSRTSWGLGENGFCDASNVTGLLDILQSTNGHDYTNYRQALYTARKLISMRTDTARPCYIVFISDGLPTYSSGYTSELMSYIDGGYTGSLADGTFVANDDFPWWGEVTGDHAGKAEQTANFIKMEYPDIPMYTVGFSTNESASALLESIATSPNNFFNCATAESFMAEMKVVEQEIMTQYPDGTVTDKIGDHFDLLIDADHPFVLDGVDYKSEGALPDTVILSRGAGTEDGEESAESEAPVETTEARVTSVSWNLTDVDQEGVTVSFYVKLKDEYLTPDFENTRIHQTNADNADQFGATLSYHQLILDTTYTLPEGYYAAEEATIKEMATPYVQLKNGEITAVKSSNKLNQALAVGESITYTITLTSQGLLDMEENIVISDEIPAGTEFVENSASDGGVYEDGKVTWVIAGLEAGAEKTVSFAVTVTEEAEEKIVNGAFFGADDPATDRVETPEIPTNVIENPLKDGEPEVYGKISIDKRFSGAVLDEFETGNRFEFVVKDEAGAVVGNIILEVNTTVNEEAGTTSNTLEQISNPLELIPGNYTVAETDYAELVGKTFVNATIANNGAITMGTADQIVVVTNNYTTNSEPEDNGGNGGGGGGGTVIIPEPPVPLTPVPEITEPEVPLGPAPDLEEILDEEVPLAAPPKTGDVSALWMALSALSGTGLAGVSILGRKKREE